jgi:hypothetical protein
MTLTVEAIYENGVLKPTEPLPFKEHVEFPRLPSGCSQLILLAGSCRRSQSTNGTFA